MLSDWLTILHAHVQSRFHVFLLPELQICQTFPTLPLDGSIELRPCDRCFRPEWIAGMDSFPIHGLTQLNIFSGSFGPGTVSPISS